MKGLIVKVYIFNKNKRCPYLNYEFYLNEVLEFPHMQLQLDVMENEYKLTKQFLENWKRHLQRNQQSFNKASNSQFNTIYNNSIFYIDEILSILKSSLDHDIFEVYLQR